MYLNWWWRGACGGLYWIYPVLALPACSISYRSEKWSARSSLDGRHGFLFERYFYLYCVHGLFGFCVLVPHPLGFIEVFWQFAVSRIQSMVPFPAEKEREDGVLYCGGGSQYHLHWLFITILFDYYLLSRRSWTVMNLNLNLVNRAESSCHLWIKQQSGCTGTVLSSQTTLNGQFCHPEW